MTDQPDTSRRDFVAAAVTVAAAAGAASEVQAQGQVNVRYSTRPACRSRRPIITWWR